MITYDYIIQIFRMIRYDNEKILCSEKTNLYLKKQMTGGLYMKTNRWISSKQHIGQTKIGLLCKITGAGVTVCLFNPSENMNQYVQVVYIE